MTLFEAHSTVKVNPARAGMIRVLLLALVVAFSKPRASGDDPYVCRAGRKKGS